MVVDVTRLFIGLLIVAFHRPLADFILHQEKQLVTLFHSRGLRMPIPTQSTARNVYFGLGMIVTVLSLVRLWTAVHP